MTYFQLIKHNRTAMISSGPKISTRYYKPSPLSYMGMNGHGTHYNGHAKSHIVNEVGHFTRRLISLMKTVMRRQNEQ